MGQVLLASLLPAELDRYFRAARPARFTAKTRVSRREIETRLEEVRRQGYALADQELEEGLRSLAVPLHDRAGHTVAAINVSAHAARVPAKTLVQEYFPVLKQGADTIERLLKTR
jgi:IclR family pca regulon transcriptional regulator